MKKNNNMKKILSTALLAGVPGLVLADGMELFSDSSPINIACGDPCSAGTYQYDLNSGDIVDFSARVEHDRWGANCGNRSSMRLEGKGCGSGYTANNGASEVYHASLDGVFVETTGNSCPNRPKVELRLTMLSSGECKITFNSSGTNSGNTTRIVNLDIRRNLTWSGVPTEMLESSADHTVTMSIQDNNSVTTGTPYYTSLYPEVCGVDQSGVVSYHTSGTCRIQASTVLGNYLTVKTEIREWTVHSDTDSDGVRDSADNCPNTANGPSQASLPGIGNQTDTDGNGIGDACNDHLDADGDEYENSEDNCPGTSPFIVNPATQYNPSQTDTDGNGVGDICDIDSDGDGLLDHNDNCPQGDGNGGSLGNSDQTDSNNDGVGDLCAADTDGDTLDDKLDNCPNDANLGQSDSDGDGIGDICEPDTDGDGVLDDDTGEKDNCPLIANGNQQDSNGNGIGDVCEVRFVTADGDDNNDCETWSTACATIAEAVSKADAADVPNVFIQKGLYREAAISVPAGLTLVGGFNGTTKEIFATSSNPTVNLTVLNGDSGTADTNQSAIESDLAEILNATPDDIQGANQATLLSVATGSTGEASKVTLSGLIFSAASDAAVTVSNSNVEIISSRFIGNSGSNGAALRISNNAQVVMTGSVFTRNKSSDNGGAISVSGSSTQVSIDNSVLEENEANASSGNGGAIRQSGGTVSTKGTRFEKNTAASAGAVSVTGSSSLYAIGSFFVENQALASNGGAIVNASGATLVSTSSEYTGNVAAQNGGAISAASSATIAKSFFEANEAANGGALYSNTASVVLNVVNSTFYANEASSNGGVVRTDNASTQVSLVHITAAKNKANGNGGALSRGSGVISLKHSIVAGNTAGGTGANIHNGFTDADYNIIGYNGVSGLDGSHGNKSFTPTSEQADSLTDLLESEPGNKGGDGYYSSVQTLPISGGSVARDVISYADCTAVVIEDARGEVRPDIKASMCDIGAYEFTVLSCEEDAQRRFAQGEVFVKSCAPDWEGFEIGNIGWYGFLLALFAGAGGYRRRQAAV